MSPTFRSLHVRNYRIYASGQLAANVGVWMQRVAQDWLVLQLSGGSALALGLTVALQFLPIALFSLWGGSLADRFPRRRLLTLTASAMGALALLLGAIVLAGLATVGIVMAMSFALGVVAALDSPARQAMVSELVTRDDLHNAVALNSASFNLGRVLGPATAGFLVAAVGSGWVFVINALGYVTVVVALQLLRADEMTAPEPVQREKGMLREGVRYVSSRPPLVLVMVIAFFVGTFGLNYQLTMALMTIKEFGLGPAEFGLASTVLAVGSLTGSLLAARRGAPQLRLVVMSAVLFGVAAMVASTMPTYATFLLALPWVGAAALTLINSAQSYLQLHSEPQVRGRVMGLYMLVFMGGTPLGSPLVGWVADAYGPRWSIALGGAVSAVAALVAASLLLRRDGLRVEPHLRPHPRFDVVGQQA
ncbi:MAG: MFS transporter [Actinomycetes bacterium]